MERAPLSSRPVVPSLTVPAPAGLLQRPSGGRMGGGCDPRGFCSGGPREGRVSILSVPGAPGSFPSGRSPVQGPRIRRQYAARVRARKHGGHATAVPGCRLSGPRP